jgi:excisionase family DNA binding protein
LGSWEAPSSFAANQFAAHNSKTAATTTAVKQQPANLAQGRKQQHTMTEQRSNSKGAITFERLLGSQEAAELLRIHPKTLQKLAREGTVPAHRIGDLWRVRASELNTWLAANAGRDVHSHPPLVP